MWYSDEESTLVKVGDTWVELKLGNKKRVNWRAVRVVVGGALLLLSWFILSLFFLGGI